MADHTLGTVALDLVVNHGAFLTGFSEAGLASKRFGKDIQDSFSSVGSAAERLIGNFSPIASQISSAFAGIGSSIRSSLSQIPAISQAVSSAVTAAGSSAAEAMGLTSGAVAGIGAALGTATT